MSSKIVVISVYNKTYEEIYHLTYPHNKKYFDKYNIDYAPVYIDCEDDVAQNCFKKFDIIHKLMQSNDDIDYIYSMDIDIVVCNFNMDIRNIIRFTKKDLLFCSVLECSPDMYWNINAGSIILKNSHHGKSLMNRYMSIAKDYNFSINDQVLWQSLLRNDSTFRNHSAIFPANTFNAGGADFFMHHELSASSTRMHPKEACAKKIEILRHTISQIKS